MAVGVAVKVFKVFFLDWVLQRLVEQINEDGIIMDKTGFVEQNLEAWVWWRRSPT